MSVPKIQPKGKASEIEATKEKKRNRITEGKTRKKA